MNAKDQLFEFVNLVKVYRNGQEQRVSMPRWLAEMDMGCIPHEQPDVARARIEPIRINAQAHYPVKYATPERCYHVALQMAAFMPMCLAG